MVVLPLYPVAVHFLGSSGSCHHLVQCIYGPSRPVHRNSRVSVQCLTNGEICFSVSDGLKVCGCTLISGTGGPCSKIQFG